MCWQTKNSCTKAFGSRSGSKHLKPKNREGGGGGGVNLTPSRVNIMIFFAHATYRLLVISIYK